MLLKSILSDSILIGLAITVINVNVFCQSSSGVYPDYPNTGDDHADALEYEENKKVWYLNNGGNSVQPNQQILPPIVNDSCKNAVLLSSNSTVTGSTIGSTSDDVLFCGTASTSPGVWYMISGQEGVIELSTCEISTDFDTKISVFEGSCNSLVCVSGNDDDLDCGQSIFHSTVKIVSDPSKTYYVLIHGFSAQEGNFELSVSLKPNFSKSFTPDSIFVNSIATLEFVINNNGSGVNANNLEFMDTFPMGMIVDAVPNVISSCNGILVATPGESFISFSGGAVSAGSTCSIQVNITSDSSGTRLNTSQDLISSLGNSGSASASLVVLKRPTPEPIPTLSTWSLITLSMILMILGVNILKSEFSLQK